MIWLLIYFQLHLSLLPPMPFHIQRTQNSVLLLSLSPENLSHSLSQRLTNNVLQPNAALHLFFVQSTFSTFSKSCIFNGHIRINTYITSSLSLLGRRTLTFYYLAFGLLKKFAQLFLSFFLSFFFKPHSLILFYFFLFLI